TGAAAAVVISLLWGANSGAIQAGLEDTTLLRPDGTRVIVGGVVISHRVRPRGAPRRVLARGVFRDRRALRQSVEPRSADAPGRRDRDRRGHSPGRAHRLPGAGRPAARAVARAVQRLDPVRLLLAQAVVGTACFALASFLVEPATTRWTVRLAGSIAYQGVLISGFNFVVNLALLRDYRPSALSAFFLTQPIFGVVAAALVAGDPITPVLVLACVAVAAGIGLTYRGGPGDNPRMTTAPSRELA